MESAPDITVFPNSAEDIVNIVVPKEFNHPILKVYNIQGQVVYQTETTIKGSHEMTINFLDEGTYFVKVTDRERQIFSTAKFIKK
ncbi:MAG: T9SS type A sorting domain-containing protein [Bacteroidota bacterium]